jgi:hypothetical protein
MATVNPVTSVVDEPGLPHGTSCARCGTPLEAEDRFCPGCGAVHEAPSPPPLPPTVQKHFRCETCGAEVATGATQRSYTCPFCESNYVIEVAAGSDRIAPEFVLGFAVTREAAAEKFRAWLATNPWFRPGDLPIAAKVVERLRGVYVPFWSFSLLAESEWSARIGEYWQRTETYTTIENGKSVTKTRTVTETEWWDLAGRHHDYYSGYLVSGSRGLAQADADRSGPFHLAGLRRYDPSYLAGWLCEDYSIARDAAFAHCERVFLQRERDAVEAFLPGDTHDDLRVRTEFSRISSDLILLPVYLLSYQYGGKPYKFLINGQTGKIAGDKPLSWRRIGLAIAAAIALVAAIAMIILTINSL